MLQEKMITNWSGWWNLPSNYANVFKKLGMLNTTPPTTGKFKFPSKFECEIYRGYRGNHDDGISLLAMKFNAICVS